MKRFQSRDQRRRTRRISHTGYNRSQRCACARGDLVALSPIYFLRGSRVVGLEIMNVQHLAGAGCSGKAREQRLFQRHVLMYASAIRLRFECLDAAVIIGRVRAVHRAQIAAAGYRGRCHAAEHPIANPRDGHKTLDFSDPESKDWAPRASVQDTLDFLVGENNVISTRDGPRGEFKKVNPGDPLLEETMAHAQLEGG